MRFLAIIALAVCFATPALAHHRSHHHYRHHHHFIAHKRVRPAQDWATAWDQPWEAPVEASNFGGGLAHGLAHMLGSIGPRPAAWCGWEARQLVSHDPGPAYNLARNWAHWGHPGPAGVGALVVWEHHVGKIVGQQNGQWIIESGNDGHRLRTRPRSIAGAIAIRWDAGSEWVSR